MRDPSRAGLAREPSVGSRGSGLSAEESTIPDGMLRGRRAIMIRSAAAKRLWKIVCLGQRRCETAGILRGICPETLDEESRNAMIPCQV